MHYCGTVAQRSLRQGQDIDPGKLLQARDRCLQLMGSVQDPVVLNKVSDVIAAIGLRVFPSADPDFIHPALTGPAVAGERLAFLVLIAIIGEYSKKHLPLPMSQQRALRDAFARCTNPILEAIFAAIHAFIPQDLDDPEPGTLELVSVALDALSLWINGETTDLAKVCEDAEASHRLSEVFTAVVRLLLVCVRHLRNDPPATLLSLNAKCARLLADVLQKHVGVSNLLEDFTAQLRIKFAAVLDVLMNDGGANVAAASFAKLGDDLRDTLVELCVAFADGQLPKIVASRRGSDEAVRNICYMLAQVPFAVKDALLAQRALSIWDPLVTALSADFDESVADFAMNRIAPLMADLAKELFRLGLFDANADLLSQLEADADADSGGASGRAAAAAEDDDGDGEGDGNADGASAMARAMGAAGVGDGGVVLFLGGGRRAPCELESFIHDCVSTVTKLCILPSVADAVADPVLSALQALLPQLANPSPYTSLDATTTFRLLPIAACGSLPRRGTAFLKDVSGSVLQTVQQMLAKGIESSGATGTSLLVAALQALRQLSAALPQLMLASGEPAAPAEVAAFAEGVLSVAREAFESRVRPHPSDVRAAAAALPHALLGACPLSALRASPSLGAMIAEAPALAATCPGEATPLIGGFLRICLWKSGASQEDAAWQQEALQVLLDPLAAELGRHLAAASGALAAGAKDAAPLEQACRSLRLFRGLYGAVEERRASPLARRCFDGAFLPLLSGLPDLLRATLDAAAFHTGGNAVLRLLAAQLALLRVSFGMLSSSGGASSGLAAAACEAIARLVDPSAAAAVARRPQDGAVSAGGCAALRQALRMVAACARHSAACCGAATSILAGGVAPLLREAGGEVREELYGAAVTVAEVLLVVRWRTMVTRSAGGREFASDAARESFTAIMTLLLAAISGAGASAGESLAPLIVGDAAAAGGDGWSPDVVKRCMSVLLRADEVQRLFSLEDFAINYAPEFLRSVITAHVAEKIPTLTEDLEHFAFRVAKAAEPVVATASLERALVTVAQQAGLQGSAQQALIGAWPAGATRDLEVASFRAALRGFSHDCRLWVQRGRGDL